VNKSKLLKGAGIVALTAMLPLSQAAADGNWGISGWINEAMLYYDDGVGSDVAQVSDNGTTLGSRITLSGDTDLPNSNLKAGFEVIIEPQNAAGAGEPLGSGQLAVETATGVREAITELGHSAWLSGGFGKVTVGLQSMPTDNIAVLHDPSLTLWSNISPVFRGAGFTIQGVTGSKTTWGSFLQCNASGLTIGVDCNGVYRNGLRYDLPEIFPGVGLAVGYANDDIYDIALNYSGTLAGLNATLGMGYAHVAGGTSGAIDGTAAHVQEADNFQMQAGLMDPGTGIFGSIAYQNEDGKKTAANAAAIVGDDTDSWYTKVGIKKGFNSLGDTSIAFIYGSYNDEFGGADTSATRIITGSEVERVGFTVDQYFGSRFILYGAYENLSLDVDCTAATSAACATAYGGAQDLDIFAAGFTFFF
jgi:hypothetical protein